MESIKCISPFAKKYAILTKYSADLKPQNDVQYINVKVLNREVWSSLVFHRICEVIVIKLGFDKDRWFLTEGVLRFIHLKQINHYRTEKHKIRQFNII